MAWFAVLLHTRHIRSYDINARRRTPLLSCNGYQGRRALCPAGSSPNRRPLVTECGGREGVSG